MTDATIFRRKRKFRRACRPVSSHRPIGGATLHFSTSFDRFDEIAFLFLESLLELRYTTRALLFNFVDFRVALAHGCVDALRRLAFDVLDFFLTRTSIRFARLFRALFPLPLALRVVELELAVFVDEE